MNNCAKHAQAVAGFDALACAQGGLHQGCEDKRLDEPVGDIGENRDQLRTLADGDERCGRRRADRGHDHHQTPMFTNEAKRGADAFSC